jgi:hypothetical protein
LLAALMLAVASPHVFATSHPMPGSLGDFLLLLTILLFLKCYKNNFFLPLLFLSTIALAVTHHFSIYFLFIILTTFVFLRELFKTSSELKRLRFDIAYLTIVFITIIIYWLVIAVPFKKVIATAFNLPAEVIFLATSLSFLVLVLIVKLRRKLFTKQRLLKKPTQKKLLVTYFLGLTLALCGLLISVRVKFPGTNIAINETAILIFLPAIIVFCFAAWGLQLVSLYENGIFIYAWFLAVAGSMFLGVVTNNTTLIPYRHLQYLIIPAAILAGVGITGFLASLKKKTLTRALISLALILFVFTAPLSCYPPRSVLGGFEEGTPEENISMLVWAGEYLTGEPIASDHRLSSMLFGFSECKPSWEFVSKVFHSGTFSEEVAEELANSTLPAGKFRIEYIVIDELMKSGVCLEQWEPALPMSKESIAKFSEPPFIKVYDDGFTQIYKIDWH